MVLSTPSAGREGPRYLSSGTWLSRFSAKGVGAVETCGGDPSRTDSSAAGGTSVAVKTPWPRAERKERRDLLNENILRR